MVRVDIVDCRLATIKKTLSNSCVGNKKSCPDFSIVNSFVKQRLMVTFPCHLVAKLGITIVRRKIFEDKQGL